MKNFIIHNADGKILRTGYCPDDHVVLQVLPGAGEYMLYGTADELTQYIDLTDPAMPVIAQLPPQPDQYYDFDWPSKQWLKPADYADRVANAQHNEWMHNRARSYPPLADLADAIYWQARGEQSLMDAYLAECDAVKVKYPKP